MVSGVDGAIEREENMHKTYEIARKLGATDLLASEKRVYLRDGTLVKGGSVWRRGRCCSRLC